MKKRAPRREDKVQFDEETADLSISLDRLALLRYQEDACIGPGQRLDGSVVAIGSKLEVEGQVTGHLVAVGCDVFLEAEASVGKYLYLVDSRLHCEGLLDSSQKFHSTLLPGPWSQIVITARDSLEGGGVARASGGLGEPRVWRFRAEPEAEEGIPSPRERILSIDTRTGMTQMTKGDGGPIRFFVDGVEQTSRFGRYANESLSFCCGPVLAFGGKGATLSKSRREWRIHSGDVVVASTDGLVAMGANEGVLYQVEKECLVGSKAVIRLDLPGRQETIEGSELIYRIPDQSVEVRP